MRRIILPAVVMLGLLSACTVNPATGLPVVSGGQDPLATLGKFTVTDLQNADALALAAQDKTAHQCFAYLIPVVQQAQATQSKPGLPVSGAFSGFEASRVAITGGKALLGGIPADLNLACAPLVLDAANTVIGLAAKVGVSVALPGLGNLIPVP